LQNLRSLVFDLDSLVAVAPDQKHEYKQADYCSISHCLFSERQSAATGCLGARSDFTVDG